MNSFSQGLAGLGLLVKLAESYYDEYYHNECTSHINKWHLCEVSTTLPCIVCFTTLQHHSPPQARCYYVVLKAFNEAIDSKGLSPANEAIMRKLCSLYAMYWIVQRSGDFMTVSTARNI